MSDGLPTAVASFRSAALNEGRAYWFLGNLALVHVAGEQTAETLCVVEFEEPAGSAIPLHAHRGSQTTYVLAGELTVHLPGESHVLSTVDCVHQPPGVRKTHRVTSAEPARCMDINVPAGFDAFIAAVGCPAESLVLPRVEEPPDLERLIAIAAEHGIDILGPPGQLP